MNKTNKSKSKIRKLKFKYQKSKIIIINNRLEPSNKLMSKQRKMKWKKYSKIFKILKLVNQKSILSLSIYKKMIQMNKMIKSLTKII